MNVFDPSPYQKGIWGQWYLATEPSTDGEWMGWCPLHTQPQDRKPEQVNAGYNFLKGIFACYAEDSCLGDKKSVSLSSLSDRIAAKILNPAGS